MPHPSNDDRARRLPRAAAVLVAGLTGFALAAAGIAAASTPFTLRVQKNTHVTNAAFASFRVRAVNKKEAVAIGRSGYAVYTFQGETTRHIICHKTGNQSTNCWGFWPPVTVKSAKRLTAQTGIRGKLGAFHNHGVLQLTLNHQPVYYFTPDLMSGHKGTAQGDELKTFGSIWHIVTDGPAVASGPSSTGSTTTTTNPNPYPPGYTY